MGVSDPKQRQLIREALEKNDYYKASPNKAHEHRREYVRKRKELIREWEKNTGQKWPTYTEPVYSKHGDVVRIVGATYDAHHILENSWLGDNEWWNMYPAKFPDEHQKGIHRKDGYADQIFNQ